MTQEQARGAAEALGGEAWQSGGNIWLVRFRGPDGRLVVISDDLIREYEDDAAFEDGRAAKTIELPAASLLGRV
jgi:hypothetical protein